MTVKELAKELNCQVICMPDGEREVKGGYAGDLLSWVIGRASADCVWVTIMSNLNVVAVASLADVSCVLLSENVSLDSEEVLNKAISQGINILKTDLDTFSACKQLSQLV